MAESYSGGTSLDSRRGRGRSEASSAPASRRGHGCARASSAPASRRGRGRALPRTAAAGADARVASSTPDSRLRARAGELRPGQPPRAAARGSSVAGELHLGQPPRARTRATSAPAASGAPRASSAPDSQARACPGELRPGQPPRARARGSSVAGRAPPRADADELRPSRLGCASGRARPRTAARGAWASSAPASHGRGRREIHCGRALARLSRQPSRPWAGEPTAMLAPRARRGEICRRRLHLGQPARGVGADAGELRPAASCRLERARPPNSHQRAARGRALPRPAGASPRARAKGSSAVGAHW
ncbi:uncharacterized protein [Miscanthus floridulus]|uniref:uncharacterized protein n=1 Tax=Miscanthus floridulus TaxID=154761 RepID=UPI003457F853